MTWIGGQRRSGADSWFGEEFEASVRGNDCAFAFRSVKVCEPDPEALSRNTETKIDASACEMPRRFLPAHLTLLHRNAASISVACCDAGRHPLILLNRGKRQPHGRPRPGRGHTFLSSTDGPLLAFRPLAPENSGLQPLAHSDRKTACGSTEDEGD